MNAYFNERYMLYFDVHYGKHVRSFVEFKSGLNSYRIGGPRPIDEKKLDFRLFPERQFSSMVVGSLPTTLPFVTVAEVTFRYDFNMPVQRAAVSRLLDID